LKPSLPSLRVSMRSLRVEIASLLAMVRPSFGARFRSTPTMSFAMRSATGRAGWEECEPRAARRLRLVARHGHEYMPMAPNGVRSP
jgi:hypothetical protein